MSNTSYNAARPTFASSQPPTSSTSLARVTREQLLPLHDALQPAEAAPSVFTSPSTGWLCIQKLIRRDDLVFIQIQTGDRMEHGYTLNEYDELNYWRKGPGGEIAFTPLQYELIIRPEELAQDLCKLVPIRYDNHVGGGDSQRSSCASPT